MEKSNEIPKISLFSYVPENFRVNFSIWTQQNTDN